MKQIIKKLLKNYHVQGFLCLIGSIYIRLVYYTLSWHVEEHEDLEKVLGNKKGAIIVFWHGRLLMMPVFADINAKKYNKTTCVVISNHKDGQLIARVMGYFNSKLIRGSSNNNDSVSALKLSLESLKNKEILGITPDGPRGPRMRVGGNVVKIAQMADVPVIPVTYSVKRCKILKSWDRFMFPKLFNKGVFLCGKSIKFNKNISAEKANKKLEEAMNKLTKDADILVGIEPVCPD